MDIISRKEAKARGLKRYFTGKPCKHGHVAERFMCGVCVICSAKQSRQWNEDNPEYKLGWCGENSKRLTEKARRWREENVDKYRELSKYSPSNYAHTAKRRAAKIHRTFDGYDDQIKNIYIQAAKRRASGEDVHVDHVVPLQGKTVSGLHVPCNLEIIPARENFSKNNRFLSEIEIHQ